MYAKSLEKMKGKARKSAQQVNCLTPKGVWYTGHASHLGVWYRVHDMRDGVEVIKQVGPVPCKWVRASEAMKLHYATNYLEVS